MAEAIALGTLRCEEMERRRYESAKADNRAYHGRNERQQAVSQLEAAIAQLEARPNRTKPNDSVLVSASARS